MWQNTLIWAVLILIIFILTWCFYGPDIKKFLHKSNKVRLGGKTWGIELGSPDPTPLEAQTSTTKQHEFSKAFQSPIVTNQEKIIREQLTQLELSDEDAIDLLIYQLANKNLINAILNLDRLIFDEQIEVLAYLNSKNCAIEESALVKFYEQWKSRAKDQSYSYQNFLGFLVASGVALRNFDGTFVISLLGKEYLGFLIRTSSSRLKVISQDSEGTV